ncbi:MAG TPA: GxxExxY protein [Victivallales bacterium]|nr:GxxExxY protein [Victivallales bacterium]
MSELIFKNESFKIIGACFEVYKDKGHGFLEAVYQECLAIEFKDSGIPFIEQPEMNLEYKGKKLKHHYVPDFLCFDKIILELEAVKDISDEHRAQIINYLKSSNLQLGLLVNFGHYPKLEYERFVNQKGTTKGAKYAKKIAE